MATIRRLLAVVTVCVLALFAAGCGAVSSSPEGTWTGDEGTELELTVEGLVTGTDGCNHLSGTWEQDGETVTFSGMVGTLMACMDVDVWLTGPATATIDGDTMVVFNSEGAELGELQRS
ncbi:META domain-containing protein [Ruania zhangjianzhongii]|uniref:META domain-containing protein n=1 Tax=Ruania zhangjianzhongii TaxID=2603206 RepID=UPI0011C80E94|nr:META domain-containing protein [Ruania zhangjianzhongii]